MLNHAQPKIRSLSLMVALATTMFVMGSNVLPAGARFKPPDQIRRPGNRIGLATRGGTQCRAARTPPLTTVVPLTLYGRTLSGYPTFYWYMPENTYDMARFVLYDMSGSEPRPVYRSNFTISGQTGLAHLTLPMATTLAPLEVGKMYRWMVVLVCTDHPSLNVFAEGWIERVTPSAKLKARLAVAQPDDRFRVYGEAGVWYDMLRDLAQLRQANPMQPTPIGEWQTLMDSEAVELSQLPTQPFVSAD